MISSNNFRMFTLPLVHPQVSLAQEAPKKIVQEVSPRKNNPAIQNEVSSNTFEKKIHRRSISGLLHRCFNRVRSNYSELNSKTTGEEEEASSKAASLVLHQSCELFISTLTTHKNFIIAGYSSCKIRIWDTEHLAASANIAEFRCDAPPSLFAMVPEKDILLVAYGRMGFTWQLFDLSDLQEVTTIKFQGRALDLSVTRQGCLAVAGGDEKNITFWTFAQDYSIPTVLAHFNSAHFVRSVLWLSDEKTLLYATDNRTLSALALTAEGIVTPLKSVHVTDRIKHMTLLPDGDLLLTKYTSCVSLYNWAGEKELAFGESDHYYDNVVVANSYIVTKYAACDFTITILQGNQGYSCEKGGEGKAKRLLADKAILSKNYPLYKTINLQGGMRAGKRAQDFAVMSRHDGLYCVYASWGKIQMQKVLDA